MRKLGEPAKETAKEVVWMKACKNCGAQLDDQAKFCRYCGKSVEESTQSFQNTGSMYGNQNTGNMYGNQNTGNMYGYQNSTYDQGYGGYQQPVPAKTCGFSVASLVLSLIGIFFGYLGAAFLAGDGILGSVGVYSGGILILFAFLFFLPSILGILFGIAGISKARMPGVSGKGLAIAGLVIGIIFFLLWFCVGMYASSMVNSYVSYYGGW